MEEQPKLEVDWSGPPRRRYFRWRANERAGREGQTASAGAFNGTCLVYEGDVFFMEVRPIVRKGADGVERPVMPRPPTWADPLEEYEPPAAPKLLKRVEPRQGHEIPAPPPLSTSRSPDAPYEPTPLAKPKGRGRGRWGPRTPKPAPVESPAQAPVHAE